jgi:hypothetical protein
MKRLLLPLFFVILAGCAGPRFRYDTVSGADESGAQKFQIADSLITFTYPNGGSSVAPSVDTSKMVVSSNPVAWDNTTYQVSGVSWFKNWGTQTDATVTHASTSLLMSQLGAQVTDEVQAVATDAGSMVQGALTLGATFGLFSGQPQKVTPGANLQDKPPVGILASQFIDDAVDPKKLKCTIITPTTNELKSGSRQARDMQIVCKGITLDGGGKGSGSTLVPYIADIVVGAVPPDAFQVEFPYYSKAMLYSACRSFTITVYDPIDKDPDGNNHQLVTATTLVADPTWFEAVAVPPNGHGSLNAACGADTVSGTYTPPDGMKDASAIITAINNVASSLKSKKSSGASAPNPH